MEQQILKVSQLTDIIKTILEESFPSVTIEGEISNWKPSASGHIYFTLKDKTASIQAVMFKGRASFLSFKPVDGMLVHAKGEISVYGPRGQYQLIVSSMEKAGSGDILAMLEERKQRLASLGLFDSDKKKPIPPFPSKVAVITSPTGAAIRDILSVMKRRNAGIKLNILPAVVQGEDAAPSMIEMIKIANMHKLGDVIILGRGGGSLEDLLAFSDEDLVKAIADSELPIISAVGHEIDWSLSDFASDLRAPTPSAAAELVSQNAVEIKERIETARQTIELAFNSIFQKAKYLIESFSTENLQIRLEKAMQPTLQRFDDAKESLVTGIRDACINSKHRLVSATKVLKASSPISILERGFSVVHLENNGKLIRSSDELKAGDKVDIRFAKGNAKATITENKKMEDIK